MTAHKPDAPALSPTKAALLARLTGDLGKTAPPDHASAAASAVESRLMALWSEHFGRPVALDDDYFALGGDSIMALRLAARSRSDGLGFRGADLFSYPTIRQLAPQVEDVPPDGLATAARPSPEARPHRDVPLTPMQQGILYQCQRAGRGAAYVSQFSCAFPDALNVNRMIAAWAKVAEARFCLSAHLAYRDDGRPVFRRAASAPMDVLRCDWRDWPAAEAQAAFEVLARADRERGFDLDQGPLSRLVFVRMPDAAWRCIWSHHHMILDGWSQLILLEDCFAAYRKGDCALADDAPAVADFALRQRDALSSQARAYWRTALAEARPTSFAPAGDAPAAGSEIDIGACTLPEDVSQSLDAVARRNGTTRAALCEVVWALVLADLRAAERVTFGRVHTLAAPGPTGTDIAWLCINTLPCAHYLAPETSIEDILRLRQRHISGLPDRLEDPLSEILKLCPNAGFGSVLVHENFRDGVSDTARRLDPEAAPTDIAFRIAEHHPLVCVISDEASRIGLEIKIDRGWSVPGTAETWLARFRAIARCVAQDPALGVGTVLSRSRGGTAPPGPIAGRRRHAR